MVYFSNAFSGSGSGALTQSQIQTLINNSINTLERFVMKFDYLLQSSYTITLQDLQAHKYLDVRCQNLQLNQTAILIIPDKDINIIGKIIIRNENNKKNSDPATLLNIRTTTNLEYIGNTQIDFNNNAFVVLDINNNLNGNDSFCTLQYDKNLDISYSSYA